MSVYFTIKTNKNTMHTILETQSSVPLHMLSAEILLYFYVNALRVDHDY